MTTRISSVPSAFLVHAGFFIRDDVTEALTRIEHEDVEALPENLRRIIEVVWNFKRAADR